MRRRRAGELESEVLAALWASERAVTPGEVHRSLDGSLAYNTVFTILTRLLAKGLIEREKVGRAHLYRPSVERAELAARHMRTALEREDDKEAVLQRFVDGLSPYEGHVIGRMLHPPKGNHSACGLM